MLNEQGLTETDIGKEIGKTQQYVSAKLRLLRLEPKIQVQITSRLVSAEHGYEVSKIEDGKRRRIEARVTNLENAQASMSDLKENIWCLVDDVHDPKCSRSLLASNGAGRREASSHRHLVSFSIQ